MTSGELDKVYRDHGHAVLRRAKRMLRDDEDARDVVHDVYLELLRNADRFEARSSIATYLYAAATHACLNRLRDGRNRRRLLEVRTAAGERSTSAQAEPHALALEILNGLDADDAALAVYLYCDELTHDEIAELFGCSRRHVGDLAMRLRRRIMERAA
ncbi:MAG TPA: sigma-70 family RNA polymerase sigma factor [Kofleriaceae bacterium]|nr:sigma-70 family RNA polymerase sigma factor [Kofleriaceae bacterium]